MNPCLLINRSFRIIPCLVVLLLSLATLSFAGQYQVLRLVDGDTIVIIYQGKPEKVRLFCVNTPESVHPDKKQNVPMGKVASDYAKKRLSDKSVDLEFEGNLRGKYGRLLAYVFVDGQNFNIELVKHGLSPYYTKYGLSEKYDQEFREAEKYARDHKLNIWGDTELSKKYLRLKSKWGQHSSRIESSAATIQNKDWKYVASKKSQVFHIPTCKWAQKINPENLVGFGTREEAVASGKRPCKTCMP